MNDRIATTLRTTAEQVVPPPPDDARVARLVRRHRRRRRGAAVAGLVAVAAVAVAAPSAVDALGEDRSVDPSVATGRADLARPAYFVMDHRLMAVDQRGGVHEVAQGVEGVVGATGDRVVAVTEESEPLVFAARKGPGGWSWRAAVSGLPKNPVQSLAMSADESVLAWLGLDGRVTVQEWATGEVVDRFRLDRAGALVAVSRGGAVLVRGNHTVLRTREGEVQVPGGVWPHADLVGDTLLVSGGPAASSRVYRLEGERLTPVAQLPGDARLAPTGDGAVTVAPNAGDTGSVLRSWRHGQDGLTELTGLSGHVSETRWLDGSTLAVVADGADGQDLYLCAVPSSACSRVGLPEGAHRLSVE